MDAHVDERAPAKEQALRQRLEAALELRAQGRRRAAAAALEALCADAPDWVEPRLALADLLGDGRGLAATAAELSRLLKTAPDDPRVRQRVEHAIAKRWMEPQIDPLVEAAIAAGDASETAWIAHLFAAVRKGDAQAAQRAAEAIFAGPVSPAAQLRALELVARSGQEQRARAWAEGLLAPLRDQPDQAPFAARLRAFVADLDCGAERYRGSSNVLIDRCAGAWATVVAFTALDMEPIVPRDDLRRLVLGSRANLITLAEPERLMFLTGLAPLGPTFEDTADGLRALARELGAPRLVFIGNSAGSFAAIRYAIEMPEVAQVLVTGPVTVLDPGHPVMARPRAKPMLERLSGHAPQMMENLRTRLTNRAPPLDLVVYYAEHHERDAIHAQNLEGVAGVALCPVSSKMHALGPHLSKAGSLSEILGDLVAGMLDPERAHSLANAIPDRPGFALDGSRG